MGERLPQPVHWKCRVCGLKARVPSFPVHCTCGYVQYEYPAGLGDNVAVALGKTGITKERYLKLKKSLGLKPNCKCPWRQKVLNRVEKWLKEHDLWTLLLNKVTRRAKKEARESTA